MYMKEKIIQKSFQQAHTFSQNKSNNNSNK